MLGALTVLLIARVASRIWDRNELEDRPDRPQQAVPQTDDGDDHGQTRRKLEPVTFGGTSLSLEGRRTLAQLAENLSETTERVLTDVHGRTLFQPSPAVLMA
jgi:hypothetical protein